MEGFANIRDEDKAQLIVAKREVEENFELEKWSRIAQVMQRSGTRLYDARLLAHQYRTLVTDAKQTSVPLQTSPLLKLPPELRNRIYNLSVAGSDRRLSDVLTGKAELGEPALLASCKQIREEALPIFYGCNTIHTEMAVSLDHDKGPVGSRDSMTIMTALKILGPTKCRLIGNLQVELRVIFVTEDVHMVSFESEWILEFLDQHDAATERMAFTKEIKQFMRVLRRFGVRPCAVSFFGLDRKDLYGLKGNNLLKTVVDEERSEHAAKRI